MKNYVLRVEGVRISSLIDACEEKFFPWRYTSKSGQTQILVFENYNFWRTNSDMAVIMTFDLEDTNSCKLSITIAGGAIGIGQYDWGSEGSQLKKLQEFIEECAGKNSLNLKLVDPEESGWIHKDFVPTTVTPRSFLKKCVKCRSEIPIASEKCEFCGASQPKSR